MTLPRIGFCCKWIDEPHQTVAVGSKDDCKKYNTGTTTLSWLRRQPNTAAEQKLYDLSVANLHAVKLLVSRVAQLPEQLRMVRLSSDILPMYTEPSCTYFWQRKDVMDIVAGKLSEVGEIARNNNVRLSFHPGQFTVLASEDDDIVRRSILEVEYHATMAELMGYGKTFQDFKINIHISGRRGPDGMRAAFSKLSPAARNCLTIENEENSWGVDDCLKLSDIIPVVLDVHHNWVREGVYLSPGDDRVLRIIDSWRGVRPAMHYSISKETLLDWHDSSDLPDFEKITLRGINRQKLRAHSDFYWNTASNLMIREFLHTFDIQCESKGKNLASHRLAKEIGVI